MIFPLTIPDIPQNVGYPLSTKILETESEGHKKIEDILQYEKWRKDENNLFITLTPKYYPFKNRITLLSELEDDWDGYGGYAPNLIVINKVEAFLKKLPKSYLDSLMEDSIFPNPHGTITVEWRKGNNVVSIEFGLNSSNYYSVIKNMNDSENNLDSIFSSNKLINALNTMIA